MRFCSLLLVFAFVSLAVPCFGKLQKIRIEESKREALDADVSLWQKCGSISVNGVNLDNACIQLLKTNTCELRVVGSVQNTVFINRTLDEDVAPIVCGQYLYCNVCISITKNNNNEHCANILPRCAVSGNPEYQIGCFDNSILDPILNCAQSKCPAGCSTHGTCDETTGVCKCASGYYGVDCASTSNIFERCQRVDQLSGDMCIRLTYTQCAVQVSAVVVSNMAELPLYSADYPLKQFVKFFAPKSEAICFSDQLSLCKSCIRFGNLAISDTVVQGCGNVSLDCLGENYGFTDLGCFVDDQVTTACFACENNCLGRGTCDKGTCVCNSPYTGEDCSLQSCPNDCSGQTHGSCDTKEGKCQCNPKWSGSDCSVYVATNTGGSSGASDSDKPSNTTYIIGGIIAGVVAVGLAVVAGYFIRKRIQGNRPVFRQLDLIDEDDQELMDE